MEGEYFDTKVIAMTGQPYRRRDDIPQWELSLRRLSRAQAILWHETPIAERLKALAKVDAELKKEGDR